MTEVMEKLRTTLSNGSVLHCSYPGDELCAKFNSIGVKVLGYGSYGAVVDNGDNVIKTFSTEEVGYGAFLQYVKGKSSVLFPKITHIGSYGPWSCVSIEKLEDMRSAMGYDLAQQLMYWIHDYQLRRVAKRNNKYDRWKTIPRPKFPAAASAFVNKANIVGCLEKMIDFMFEYNNKNEKKIFFDLHVGNMMVRGGNQLVFTDPWAER